MKIVRNYIHLFYSLFISTHNIYASDLFGVREYAEEQLASCYYKFSPAGYGCLLLQTFEFIKNDFENKGFTQVTTVSYGVTHNDHQKFSDLPDNKSTLERKEKNSIAYQNLLSQLEITYVWSKLPIKEREDFLIFLFDAMTKRVSLCEKMKETVAFNNFFVLSNHDREQSIQENDEAKVESIFVSFQSILLLAKKFDEIPSLKKTIEEDFKNYLFSQPLTKINFSYLYRNRGTFIELVMLSSTITNAFPITTFNPSALYSIISSNKKTTLERSTEVFKVGEENDALVSFKFLEYLLKTCSANILIHSPLRFTSFGNIDEVMVHYTYLKIFIDQFNKTLNVTIVEPGENLGIDEITQTIHNSVLNIFQSISNKLEYTLEFNFNYRGDQGYYNLYDCGRFSLIYMLNETAGKSWRDLTCLNIYDGFKYLQGHRFESSHFNTDGNNKIIITTNPSDLTRYTQWFRNIIEWSLHLIRRKNESTI